MPDSLKGKYRELFGEIAKKVNYTVGEAQKEKDGTYIAVSYTHLDVYKRQVLKHCQ